MPATSAASISPYMAICELGSTPRRGGGRVLCPLCPLPRRKKALPKYYARGTGIRQHLNAQHADVGVEALMAAFKQAEQSAATDAEPPRQPGPRCHVDLDREAFAAATAGDVQRLQACVAAGWSPDRVDRNGSTVLLWAAGGGHLAVVRYLLEALGECPRQVGVRTAAARHDGKTALHWAARNGHVDVLDYLLAVMPPDTAMKDGSTALQLACFGGHLPAVQRLVDGGASLHHRNDHGCTAAHWAALGGGVELLQWLHDRGVAFDQPQNEGQLPGHKMAAKRHWPALLWWLRCHADRPQLFNVVDSDGYTLFDLARAQHCPPDTLAALLAFRLIEGCAAGLAAPDRSRESCA